MHKELHSLGSSYHSTLPLTSILNLPPLTSLDLTFLYLRVRSCHHPQELVQPRVLDFRII